MGLLGYIRVFRLSSSMRVQVPLGLLLCALCGAAFWGVTSGQFLPFDDDIEITVNPHLRALTMSNVGWMFTDTDRTQRYTPLSWMAWALLVAARGLSPAVFHTEALLVHCANAVLAFLLILALLSRSPRARDGLSLPLAAFLAAAMWAVHPLRVEVVGWATQVRFAEAAFFVLLAVLFYLRAAGESAVAPSGKRSFWWSVGAFTTSLLFYPIGIGVVALLPVLDVYFLRRVDPATARLRDLLRLALEKIPFAIPALCVGAMTIYGRLTGDHWNGAANLHRFGLGSRLMQAAYVSVYYIWKPFDLWHLSPVYTTLIGFNPLSAPFVLSLLSVVILTAGAIAARSRFPAFTVLWAAHLALIFPVAGYFEYFHVAADRYSYLHGLLWSVMAAFALAWSASRVRGFIRLLPMALMAVLVLVMGGRSRQQVPIWHDGESLFRYLLADLRDDPYRADIYWRLGNVYMEQGRVSDAIALYDRTLRLRPREPNALQYKASTLARIADATSQADVAGRTYLEAAILADESCRVRPDGRCFDVAGYTYKQAGRLAEAEDRLARCLALSPDRPQARLDYGEVLCRRGHPAEAARQLDQAVTSAPELAAERTRILQICASAAALAPR